MSSTGDNDNVGTQVLETIGACPNCQGQGFIHAAPPHQGLIDQGVILEHPQTKQKIAMPWMTQFAYQAGPCNACAGSGESCIKVLPEKELACEFVFLHFMADHWQDTTMVKDQIGKMTKDLKEHMDQTNAPTKEGLRIILQGIGLNAIQANTVVSAVAGYAGIGL